MNIRLFYKLFGTYVAIGVLAVLIAGFFIERQLRTGLTRWVEDDMTAQAGIMLLMPDREIVRQAATPDHIVVFTEPHEYMWVGGITYYTKRLVHILKDPRYDHVSARRREPPERFLDTTEFTTLWTSGKPVLLVADVTRRDVYPILSAAGPVEVVAGIGNLVAYENKGIPISAQPTPSPSHWPSPPQ